ncbi:MAG TPA: archaemetzincin family Zn-dependent metalloprotease [Ignavibacteria bacterium]
MDIFIAPVVFSNRELFDTLIKNLERVFHKPIKQLTLDIDTDKLYSVDRRQYYSTGFLEQAIEQTSYINGKVLMITDLDIYVPVLTFLFGEAQLDGKHSVVSVCRLHEEFYSGTSDFNLLFERTVKEVLHEIGHNFGLIHCLDWDCVMHSSNSVEEVDIKGSEYCKKCRSILLPK